MEGGGGRKEKSKEVGGERWVGRKRWIGGVRMHRSVDGGGGMRMGEERK